MTTRDRKFVGSLHDKYYKGKKKPLARPPVRPTKGPSRNSLMLQVKAAGHKNYRILRKAELLEIVALNPKESTTPDRTATIIKEAVARWKKGWGTRSKTAQSKKEK